LRLIRSNFRGALSKERRLRARELFHAAGDNIEEGEALDDAMYALHALQNTSQNNRCMAYRSEAA
jgi:hypothetical protein